MEYLPLDHDTSNSYSIKIIHMYMYIRTALSTISISLKIPRGTTLPYDRMARGVLVRALVEVVVHDTLLDLGTGLSYVTNNGRVGGG